MKPSATETCNGKLISQVQHGDMFAFEELVQRHRDNVYAFGLAMTRSETEALEIAQESFLSAYLHLNEFQNEAEFAAWVHWIAATHASLRLGLRRRAQAAEGQLDAPAFDPPGAPAERPKSSWSEDADGRALSAALCRAIEDATERLPFLDRQVFLLKDIAGLSYKQIATICGNSVPSIKHCLHQARLSLRLAIDHFHSAPVNRTTKVKPTQRGGCTR